ncbi:aminotransferase class I/II-fold pyridoxal phosphate-dependent enzyme [Streptomyces hydrogenans]|uniref:aminotransferase class I/II-fold pyridoxal phosphate-dependent enzyme n=1 Tax=Streptomyces hydrogenans TaxID=1873719 RepID=UPI0033B479A2
MTIVRKAVILAAGTGSRLGGEGPKTLTPVHGRSILHRSLDQLAAAGVREVVLVVGHLADEVRAAVGDAYAGMAVSYVVSDRFRTTNNAYSLWLAREHLTEDLYLVEGDVVFGPGLLDRLAAHHAPAVCAVAPWRKGMNGTVVSVTSDGGVGRFHVGAQRETEGGGSEGLFKTINVHLLRGAFLADRFGPALDRLIRDGGTDAYYEVVLAGLAAAHEGAVGAVDCGDLPWYEVDDLTDLGAAVYEFGDDEQRLEQLCKLYGGYWRHDVVDHRLLYNLYFPPAQLVDELAADFRESLVHYPVGHAVLQQLLGAVVRQPADRLVVANGASELIKILGHTLDKVALAVPGFNEYEAVFEESAIQRVLLPGPDYRLDVDDFTDQVRAGGSRAVIITSPNNPTSMAVPREDLELLCKRLAALDCLLVVDESFVDFCDEGQSLEPTLEDHPNLVIVKSMSKVYGVGGLRLGYLLSADLDLVARFRAKLPIWNINGLAETFLRLLPRYRQAFLRSCELVRRDRDEFYDLLRDVDGLTVWRPDANYVMVRLPDGVTGPEVVRALFAEHKILTKDCAGKSMPDGEQYLRVACRTPAENRAFAEALGQLVAAATRVPAGVGGTAPAHGGR